MVIVGILAAAGWAVMKMPAAVQSVPRGSIYPDTVKRGPMTREDHGIGTLVARNMIARLEEMSLELNSLTDPKAAFNH